MNRAATDGFHSVLARFDGLRAVVVGEAILDVYRDGRVRRLSPDGPFPVVEESGRRAVLGGAGNVAANLAALGAKVELVSAVGDDPAADELRALAAEAGVGTGALLQVTDRSTLVKERVVGEGRSLIRLDSGTKDPLPETVEHGLVAVLEEVAAEADLVVVSDYRYGVVGQAVVRWLESGAVDATVVVDSKSLERFRAVPSAAITSNYQEVIESLGVEPQDDRLQHLEALAPRIAVDTRASLIAVTLDAEGVVVVDRDGTTSRVPAAGSGREVCGAGDTFTATMALALASGVQPQEAAALASRAASLVVAKPGTAVASLEELRTAGSKLCDLPTLKRLLARRRATGDTVVLTNGCFDVLHAGHIVSLLEAASFGDVLIVAVNEDDTVRRLKGPDRPLNPVEDRAAVLASLSMVDYVVPFSEDTPELVLDALRPDIYCKGGDYRGRQIPEIELLRTWGGRFETTSYVDDHSTTALLEKAKRSGLGPVREGQ